MVCMSWQAQAQPCFGEQQSFGQKDSAQSLYRHRARLLKSTKSLCVVQSKRGPLQGKKLILEILHADTVSLFQAMTIAD